MRKDNHKKVSNL